LEAKMSLRRKGPFPVVPKLIWRLGLTKHRSLLGSMARLSLISLFGIMSLCGCMSSEEPEYDVFVNKKVQNIQFKLDANNTPVIMAEVGMYYTTKKSNAWGYKDTSYRNTETILLTRKTGTWSRHSFQNLQGGWFSQSMNESMLLRNYKGELEPLIFDRNSISLYAFEGDVWKLKKKLPRDQFSYSNALPYVGSILLITTDAWQTVFNSYEGDYFNPSKRRLKVIGSDFKHIILDSNLTFDGRLLFSTQDANFVIGMVQPWTQNNSGPTTAPLDSSQYMDLLVYSWSHNPDDPKPSKQIGCRSFETTVYQGLMNILD
jgi:hypothetical protein